jgi:hypothetical protein
MKRIAVKMTPFGRIVASGWAGVRMTRGAVDLLCAHVLVANPVGQV